MWGRVRGGVGLGMGWGKGEGMGEEAGRLVREAGLGLGLG